MGGKRKVLAIALIAAAALSLPGCAKGKYANQFFYSAPLHKVRVGDIEIGYKTFGKGKPLVMIVGCSATMDTWDPNFLKALSARYEVIVFDNRGLGETTGGTKKWTIDQFADDTAGLIDSLGLGKVYLLGWSLGGDVALSFLVRHPDKLIKLISYAGDCGGTQKVDSVEYKKQLEALADVHSPLKRALAPLFPPDWMEEHPDYWKSFPFPQERSKPGNIKKQLDAYNEWPGVYDELPGTNKPVLIATGTEDVSTPPQNATILSKRIPGCWVARFRGAGHGLMYQFPDEFAGTIMTFTGSP